MATNVVGHKKANMKFEFWTLLTLAVLGFLTCHVLAHAGHNPGWPNVVECPRTAEQDAIYYGRFLAYTNKEKDIPTLKAFFGPDSYDENGIFNVDYVGQFDGRNMSYEYALTGLTIPGLFIGVGNPYIGSCVRTAKVNQMACYWNTSYGINGQSMYNLMTLTYLQFDGNCTNPKVIYNFNNEDPFAKYIFNNQAQATFNVTQTCGLIQAICPAGSPLQQYPSFPTCAYNFTYLINPGYQDDDVCPTPLTSNTGACRKMHGFVATTYLPQSAIDHCAHTGVTDQSPCVDSCLSSCGDCSILVSEGSPKSYPVRNVSSNAHCTYKDVSDSVTFQCECDPGTILDPSRAAPGKMHCSYLQCQKPKDCHSNKKYVDCVSGRCVPKRGFAWDPSPLAYNRKTMAYCPEGSNVYRNSTSNDYVCVLAGQCIVGSINADRSCREVVSTKLEKQTTFCKRVDQSDHITTLSYPRMGQCYCVNSEGQEYPCGYAAIV